MHYTTSTLISLLPAMGMATTYRGVGRQQSPIGTTGTSMLQNAGNAPGENECGVSTFTEVTNLAQKAPLVEDCKKIIGMIQEDEEWTINTEPQTIVQNGTCAFNAVTRNGEAEIGNSDIQDLIVDSIKNFERGPNDGDSFACHGGFPLYVSTAGTMPCEELRDDKKRIIVDWTIAHSADDGKGTQWMDWDNEGDDGGDDEGEDEGDDEGDDGETEQDAQGNEDDEEPSWDDEDDSQMTPYGSGSARTGNSRRPNRMGSQSDSEIWDDEQPTRNSRTGSSRRPNRMGSGSGSMDDEETTRGSRNSNSRRPSRQGQGSWGSSSGNNFRRVFRS